MRRVTTIFASRCRFVRLVSKLTPAQYEEVLKAALAAHNVTESQLPAAAKVKKVEPKRRGPTMYNLFVQHMNKTDPEVKAVKDLRDRAKMISMKWKTLGPQFRKMQKQAARSR